MQKIQKIKLNLFPDSLQQEYNRARAKYIAEYQEYKPGGFMRIGGLQNEPAIGEANWNNMFPNGFSSWSNQHMRLTSTGEQDIIDKLNEIIDVVNDLAKNKEKGGGV